MRHRGRLRNGDRLAPRQVIGQQVFLLLSRNFGSDSTRIRSSVVSWLASERIVSDFHVRESCRKGREQSAPCRSWAAKTCSGMPRMPSATITPTTTRSASRARSAPPTDGLPQVSAYIPAFRTRRGRRCGTATGHGVSPQCAGSGTVRPQPDVVPGRRCDRDGPLEVAGCAKRITISVTAGKAARDHLQPWQAVSSTSHLSRWRCG